VSPVLSLDAAAEGQPLAGEGSARGLLRAIRPKHWTKNILVFAAPGAAGVIGQTSALARAGAVFVVFCALASGTYLLNDTVDAEADRHHPVKANRPVAAGIVSVPLAATTGAVLLSAGIGASALLGWRTIVVSAAYVVVQVAYSLWLKHEPVFDLACVAAGFVLRAIAGGVALGLHISQWFLIVAMFGAMLMATGKRLAEHHQLGDQKGAHRRCLEAYSESFLRGSVLVSAAIATTAYCLWAFEKQSELRHPGMAIFFELSIVPFVLGIQRYTYVVDRGGGGRPEDVVFSDRALMAVGAVWLVLFAIGVYAP
jgi:decaprenyl-phosphate phosphoribosyltransferase